MYIYIYTYMYIWQGLVEHSLGGCDVVRDVNVQVVDIYK